MADFFLINLYLVNRFQTIVISMILKPGKLLVATAYPDPPFDIEPGDGFDGDLIKEICRILNLQLVQIKYEGENFNDIFLGLANKEYDVVISGTTITPNRSKQVLFSNPYLEFNQGIAVNTELKPNVSSFEDLKGLVAGIQKGNTSDEVAQDLLRKKILSDIKYYAYNEIELAIQDLSAGKIGLVIKLYPVISSLIRNYTNLAVPLQAETHEKLGIAVAKDNFKLRDKVNLILADLMQNGTLSRLQHKWISTT
ncbi:TPA: transporter substrate-binding domain-containing protein [Legionella pneumophila subsp. pneumophila]|nr:transporter substrate-binding domain-containing protein [Legionella pneumophila]HAT9354954.1 transporter substrate-binding domain-containing protein [Legionella pneumophila subsp. pneumophila]HAT9370257.1 transporter substrate-binding domain-containing protein [Legionella pneumophila subsp. pneumophila]